MSLSSHAAVWQSIQLGRKLPLQPVSILSKRNWALQHKRVLWTLDNEHKVIEKEVVTASLHHGGTNESGALTLPCRCMQQR